MEPVLIGAVLAEVARLSASKFNAARWDHWLLIAAFVGISALGLWLSWRSHQAAKRRRIQRRLANYRLLSIKPSGRADGESVSGPAVWPSHSIARERVPKQIPAAKPVSDRLPRKLRSRKSSLRQYR